MTTAGGADVNFDLDLDNVDCDADLFYRLVQDEWFNVLYNISQQIPVIAQNNSVII